MQQSRLPLAAGPEEISADVSAGPADRGWLLIGRSDTSAPRPLLGAVLAEARRANLATVVLPLGGYDVATMARWVRVAAAHLRDDLADERPIAYLGAGRGAAAGWVAAARGGHGGLDGVMAWNPRPNHAWAYLPQVATPSLLVVDGEAWWRLLVARAAGHRLVGAADLVTAASDPNAALLGAWFERRLLTHAGVPDLSVRRKPTVSRARTASVATAMALAAVPLSAGAAAALPDFSAGTRLAAASIAGDRGRTSGARTAAGTPAPRTKCLKAGEICGDGTINDPPLTDGIGVRWNINTNVGFATSSSASGAASEAGWVPGNPVMATTLNGGTMNQTLGDAFDGYNALCLDLNNVGGQCNTANMSVYNQNGPASLECSGRQVVLPLRTMGNFNVRRKVFVPTNDGFARWLNIITNTSASNQTVRLQTSNNLGSDAQTTIVTTSDGDATPELTDTWVTTFANFQLPSTTSSDPRLGHVLRGLGAPVGLSAINFVNADDNPFWRYQFVLGPGQTGIIMNFATARPTRALAASVSAGLANLSNPNALNCMTAQEINQVLNFKTESTAPACSLFQIITGPPKQMQVQIQDTGSGLPVDAIFNVVVTNATVAVPPYTAGTTSSVLVTATKVDQSKPATWSFDLKDVAGNTTHCT